MKQSDIQVLLKNLGNHLEEIKTIFTNTSEDKLCHKIDDNTWSPKEVLGHLFDVEVVYTYRLNKIVESDTSPSFDMIKPSAWVNSHNYNSWDSPLLIDGLIAMRRNLIYWLGRIDNSAWTKESIHNIRGNEPFRTIVEHHVKHTANHFSQIKERLSI
jgi:hypothetical protein